MQNCKLPRNKVYLKLGSVGDESSESSEIEKSAKSVTPPTIVATMTTQETASMNSEQYKVRYGVAITNLYFLRDLQFGPIR